MADVAGSIRAVLARGVSTSAEIQRALELSQPSVSRALSRLGDGIVRIGQRRAARYGLPLPIPGIGGAWPVFTISETGEPELLGRLFSLHRDQYWFEATIPSRSALTDGLPIFLQDLRPQGFIGRTVPKRCPQLGLPERIGDWKDSDVLVYLVRRGDDAIGNIVIGDESLQQFLRRKSAPIQPTETDSRKAVFTALARDAIAGEVAGSSAGGEHPKFTCVVAKAGTATNVLVKFSPTGADPVSRRWADLLVCEHLAITALKDAGLTESITELLQGDGQVFLETERFDRVGLTGRRGIVSLSAIDDCLIGRRENWIGSARSLLAQSRISQRDVERIRSIETFGRLIGNTDMHPGNLSFFLSFDGPFVLAPIYDMLPMMYAPTAASTIPDRDFELPLPNADSLDIWQDTAGIAIRYWTAVASHRLISPEFSGIAMRNSDRVRRAAGLA